MNKLGFRKALITVVLFLVVVALAIIITVSSQILKKTINDNIETSLRSSATYESAYIARHVKKSAAAVQAIAGEYERSKGKVPTEQLVRLSANISNVHKVTVGFTDGSSFASKHDINFPNGIGDITKYDPRTRSWFKQGLQSNGVALSDVFFTAIGGIPMLGALYPVENGVIFVDIRLGQLHGLLESIDVADGVVGVIADDKGLILASTAEFSPVRKNLKDLPELSEVSDSIFDNDYAFNTINIRGEENVLISKRISLVAGKEWHLLLVVEEKSAFAALSDAIQKLNTIAFTIAALSILILLLVLKKIYKPVLALKKTVVNLAGGEGDLTRRLKVTSDDDLGDIAKGINAFIENLQGMMLQVQSITLELSKGVNVLRTREAESSSILSEHMLETDMVVSAMDRLSSSALNVSENAENSVKFTSEANNIADLSKGTIKCAEDGLKTLVDDIQSTTNNVTKMSAETQEITSILSIIGSIADQTNLLALNAAIEAARAGEQGRGFAVVADEVRALAGKTQLSTNEIEGALSALKGGANDLVAAIERTCGTSQNAVNEAQEVAANLEQLTSYVTQINDLSKGISTSANEQNTIIKDLSNNVSKIHTIVDSLSHKGKSINDETESIAEINDQLSLFVSKFKLQ